MLTSLQSFGRILEVFAVLRLKPIGAFTTRPQDRYVTAGCYSIARLSTLLLHFPAIMEPPICAYRLIMLVYLPTRLTNNVPTTLVPRRCNQSPFGVLLPRQHRQLYNCNANWNRQVFYDGRNTAPLYGDVFRPTLH